MKQEYATSDLIRLRKSGEGWFSSLALFTVFVIFPLGFFYHLGGLNFSEVRDNELSFLRKELENKARVIEGVTSELLLLDGLVEYCRRSQARLNGLVRILGKKLPDGFHWLAWNQNGEIIQLPMKETFSGQKMWAELAKIFFLDTARVGETLKHPENSKVLKKLQLFLGPNIRVEEFLKGSGNALKFSWRGQEVMAYYKNLTKGLPPKLVGPNDEQVEGVMVFCRPDEIPPAFWLEVAMKSPLQIRFPENYYVGMMGGKTSFFQNGLPGSKSFVEKSRKTFVSDAETFGIVENWLGKPLEVWFSGAEKVVVFTNAANLFQNCRKNQEFLNFLLILLFISSLVAFFFTKKDVFAYVSLRWRIAGYFILAILLPTGGFLYFSHALLIQEKAKEIVGIRENMRQVGEDLQKRYQNYPEKFGRMLYGKLEPKLRKDITKAELIRRLDSTIDENLLSSYFLSDEKGELDSFNGVKQITNNTRILAKTLLRMTFKDRIGLSFSAPSLGEVLVEEVQQMAGLEKGKQLKLLRPTQLIHYEFGKLDPNMMYVTPTVDGKRRVLILEVENKVLARAFAQEEAARNRYCKSGNNKPSVELNFDVFRGMLMVPPTVPLWRNVQIQNALFRKDSSGGEISIAREPFFYYVPGGKYTNYIRPVLLASLLPISRKALLRKQQFVIVAILAFGAALFLGLTLAVKLLEPIRIFDKAFGLVGSGELKCRLEIPGKDEIGRMSESFNSMVQSLREKERMQAYVSETVLEAVRDESNGNNHKGEIIEATVLFSDIRSFTTLCETHSPNSIFEMLNELFSGFEQIIRGEGGRIDKFIGDAVMAVFLSPGEKQSLDAVNSACKMMKFVREFSNERKRNGLFPVDIGIGINSGKVMLGDVGSSLRKDLTIIGDEVNLAARLESSSKQGKYTGIILSQSTYAMVSDFVEVEEMPVTTVKGKNQSVRMFEMKTPSLTLPN